MPRKKTPAQKGAETREHGELARAKGTLCALVALFTVLALLFQGGAVSGEPVYLLLAILAAGWLAFEIAFRKPTHGSLASALAIGAFLMSFDFAFENLGWVLGLWSTSGSILAVGVVPVEIMALAFLGGTAWALYLPKRFHFQVSAMDVVVFACFGALGERIFQNIGLMAYYSWWNTGFALLSYAAVWVMLHFIRYVVLPQKK
jgi:hypothetical protein